MHRDISWRFLLIGLLFALAAAGTSMLWSGRLGLMGAQHLTACGVEDELADRGPVEQRTVGVGGFGQRVGARR